MQNQNSKIIKLSIITPNDQPIYLECDSVQLPISDGADGKGGGSYGIRYGHAKAIISLNTGKIRVYQNGELKAEFICSQGFAKITKDTVTVTVENIEK